MAELVGPRGSAAPGSPCAADAGRADAQSPQPVFVPARRTVEQSQLTAFTRALAADVGHGFADHAALHAWSVAHFRAFWRFFVTWAGDSLGTSGALDPVCEGDACEQARFFPGLRLNHADSLLNFRLAGPDAPALTAVHADGRRLRWTRGELRDAVMRLAQSLQELGVGPGDRVAAVLRNDGHAVLAALAVTAVGATISTASPDMGLEAIADRFGPLAPRLLLAHAAPRSFDTGQPLPDKVAALCAGLPALQALVLLDGEVAPAAPLPALRLEALLAAGDASRFSFQAFPFDHPLFIMFSSGTTGRPKCIVHGAGGTLLEHVKELRLHTDLRPGDKLYFHTSCSWMMWNWQLSALACGVEIVTWDGPISSVDRLWRLVADEQVTVFGTSPPYLRMSQDAGLEPGRQFALGALRAILSTGSVLHDRQFEWVARAVGPLPLQSISGGTDIIGCFVLGNPNLPVQPGRAQSRSLALDVQAWGDGAPARGIGHLVCANPFPSRPLGFHGDADGARFHAAYFAQNPGLWSHGDLIEFSPDGGARLHGRVDGVLNVRGIKVSPGEIERVLHAQPGVREAMVVERRAEGADTSTVALLVLEPEATLDGAFVARVRAEIAGRLSAAHVPDRLLDVPALPVTHNGKLSQAAARNAVSGLDVANLAALRNPECLEAIRDHPLLRAGDACASADGPLVERLQAAWSALFGIAALGPDADFFALGGNSLMAAQLMAGVKTLTGRDLPLSALLQAPTAARLAALLEAPQAAPRSLAVCLREGEGTPLFIVHGLSGTVLECKGLVDQLGTGQPIYGFEARGVDGEGPPQDRVEDIAASYVEAMRAAFPRGPYAVCGYSFGGLVALEIARLLAQAGDPPQPLCLLDTYMQQDLPRAQRALSRARRGLRTLTALPARDVGPYLAATLRRMAGLPADAHAPGPAYLPAPHDLSGAQRLVHGAMLDALAKYRPQPYDGGPITFLRARVPLGGYHDPLPVWRRVARAGLRVVPVPGGHLELVGPSVCSVAAAIDAALAPHAPRARDSAPGKPGGMPPPPAGAPA